MQAGEQAGILESLLDRLATYKEKILAIQSKIKAALFYPIAIIAVAFIITTVIMIFVIPAFKQVFTAFGADLPAPTLIVMAISDWFVAYWYIIFPVIGGSIYGFLEAWKRSLAVQIFMDRLMLKAPVFGHLVRISTIARWTRTLSTMFAAGVPLVEALDSVGGASGNYVYAIATKQIQNEVSTGHLMRRSRSVVGFWLMHTLARPDLVDDALTDLFARAARGELHVVVGGTYALGPGHIRVTSIKEIGIRDITPAMARESGFEGLVDLLKIAKHGRGERVYLVTFEYGDGSTPAKPSAPRPSSRPRVHPRSGAR